MNYTAFVKEFDAGKEGMEPILGVMFSNFYGDQLTMVSPVYIILAYIVELESEKHRRT